MNNRRFENLLRRYNYKTIRVPAIIDTRPMKRPDIKTVHSHKRWIMTIPSKIYTYRSRFNLDLGKRKQLNYQSCVAYLRIKRFT